MIFRGFEVKRCIWENPVSPTCPRDMQETNILSNKNGGFLIFVDQKQPPDKTNVPYTQMKRGHPCVSRPFYPNNLIGIVTNNNLSTWDHRLLQFSGSLESSEISQGQVSDWDV